MNWTGLVVVVVALAAASAYGLLRRSRQGRVKPVPAPASVTGGGAPVEPDLGVLLAELGAVPGQVTLLQFSSAFCAPCRATRTVLTDTVRAHPGLRHVEVDAESRLAAVRALGIWKTPTTLIVDGAGRIVGRAQGVPERAQVLAAVNPLLAALPTPQEQPS
jgi:thiol-disulfide isomerase/thioredoxin